MLDPGSICFDRFFAGLQATGSSVQIGRLVLGLYHSVWVVPLSVSLASIAVLISNMELGHGQVARIPAGLLSGAYLACGPSLALLGLSNSVGMAPPSWVGYISPALLPLAAWAYYRSLGSTEENGGEQETWIGEQTVVSSFADGEPSE